MFNNMTIPTEIPIAMMPTMMPTTISQIINLDFTWNEITNYYYNLFCFMGCSFSFLYFLVWITNIEMGWNISAIVGSDIEDTDTDTDTKPKEIPYENQMFEEYDSLEDRDLTEEDVKDLSLNTITETTPRGDVLMYYDYELQSFVYYSKTKEIPYMYLETVARKYVIKYDCKKIYVDIRKEYEKGVHKYNEIKEKEKSKGLAASGEQKEGESGANKKRQLFAAFKSYNRKAEVNSKQKDKIYILREQSNRYSYRGKIEEYKEVELPVENENKNIDFSTFKKMKIM